MARKQETKAEAVKLGVYEPSRGPVDLGPLWSISKGSQWFRCFVWTHPLGWEFRKVVDENVLATEICRHPADVFHAAAKWKSEILEHD